ncbi:MAG: UDP-4-amino-4,6-dideoxy-N-acetyl-beta-L-altrosamine transaminase [Thiohalomonadales bacterium]
MSKIPYSRQSISEEDIDAVSAVLRSDWLTTGPKVEEFEAALSDFSGAPYTVTLSSGTAALHTALALLDLSPGDEVIVPAITFVATANCVLYQGATPIFADIDASTLLIDPEQVRKNLSEKTKAIIAVDYAGQPCDYKALRAICNEHNLVLIADACHSLGAEDRGIKVGNLADMTLLSFHPVKHICTGEGGALLTKHKRYATMAKKFRNHGINADHHQREKMGNWEYDMEFLGFNYRLTDFQCALGMSQLNELPMWLQRRTAVAKRYDISLGNIMGVSALEKRPMVKHAYHLYVIRINQSATGISRDALFTTLRNSGIGVNVHYKPVFQHSYYRKRFPNVGRQCPEANRVASEILSLPIYSEISDEQVDTVTYELTKALQQERLYG